MVAWQRVGGVDLLGESKSWRIIGDGLLRRQRSPPYPPLPKCEATPALPCERLSSASESGVSSHTHIVAEWLTRLFYLPPTPPSLPLLPLCLPLPHKTDLGDFPLFDFRSLGRTQLEI